MGIYCECENVIKVTSNSKKEYKDLKGKKFESKFLIGTQFLYISYRKKKWGVWIQEGLEEKYGESDIKENEKRTSDIKRKLFNTS